MLPALLSGIELTARNNLVSLKAACGFHHLSTSGSKVNAITGWSTICRSKNLRLPRRQRTLVEEVTIENQGCSQQQTDLLMRKWPNTLLTHPTKGGVNTA